MKAILTFLALTLLLGCNAKQKIEDIHFGPGPGDMEEEIIEDC
jgi:hypothetical protein